MEIAILLLVLFSLIDSISCRAFTAPWRNSNGNYLKKINLYKSHFMLCTCLNSCGDTQYVLFHLSFKHTVFNLHVKNFKVNLSKPNSISHLTRTMLLTQTVNQQLLGVRVLLAVLTRRHLLVFLISELHSLSSITVKHNRAFRLQMFLKMYFLFTFTHLSD